MIPAMRVGRNCRLMFQMFLYRHRTCRSRGGDGEPACKMDRVKIAQREGGVFSGN